MNVSPFIAAQPFTDVNEKSKNGSVSLSNVHKKRKQIWAFNTGKPDIDAWLIFPF